MIFKLVVTLILMTYLFASEPPPGGYDHGSSAGKNNLDISLTWNPFNYFGQGQSFVVLGYGLTERLDVHGYYSIAHKSTDNYYVGLSFQFLNSQLLDLSTAAGIRTYSDNSKLHFFLPQLLYTVKLNDMFSVAGSFVDVRNKNLLSNGIAKDVFLMIKIYENIKYEIGISVGAFKPVLWKPKSGEWYPTYSLDIKIN